MMRIRPSITVGLIDSAGSAHNTAWLNSVFDHRPQAQNRNLGRSGIGDGAREGVCGLEGHIRPMGLANDLTRAVCL